MPFIRISPAGSVPLVQLSILADDDPARHFRMGQALSLLRDDNIAILGSGFASFHNMAVQRQLYFADPDGPERALWKARVAEWNTSLAEAVLSADPHHRLARLTAWRQIPHSFDIHPEGEAEHIMPLMVCAGAAGCDAGAELSVPYGGVEVTTQYWGVEAGA